MQPPADFDQTLAPPLARDRAGRRLFAGVLVSSLLHALLLLIRFGLPGQGAASPVADVPRELTVALAPVPPAPAPAEVVPEPAPAPPAPATGGMRLVAPRPPLDVARHVPQPQVRKPRRISRPLPPRDKVEQRSRVIAQDQVRNDFAIATPQPEEAPQKTLDPAEAQEGSDDGAAQGAQPAQPALAAKEEADRIAKAEAEAVARETAQLAAKARATELESERQRQAEAAQRLAQEQAKADQERLRQVDEAQQQAARAAEQARQQALAAAELKAQAEARAQAQAQARELEARRVQERAMLQQRQIEERRLLEERRQAELRKQEEQRRLDEQQRQAELRRQAEAQQAAREQAARELMQREQAAREQAAREQAAREQAAREQAAREQAARAQAIAQQAAADRAAREQGERDAAAQRASASSGAAGAGTGAGASGIGSGRAPLGSAAAERVRELTRGVDLLGGAPPAPRRADADTAGTRRLTVGPHERDVPVRMYVDSVRMKIERNGGIAFAPQDPDRVRIDPLVSIALRSDGSVEDVTIVRSSGHARVDDAVRRIIRVNARYAVFPPNIASRYDVIEIRRIWRFAETLTLLEEVP